MTDIKLDKNIFNTILKTVRDEHAQMPNTCPDCGGKLRKAMQALVMRPNGKMGDDISYRCVDCGSFVSKSFDLPDSHPLNMKSE